MAVTDSGLCQVLNGNSMKATFKETNRMREIRSALEIMRTNQDPEIPAKKKKEPRRVVYCSDGVYEEYSTDEEEIEEQKRAEEQRKQRALIDPKGLSWMPWMIHYSWLAGSRVFNYADSWGERLAW